MSTTSIPADMLTLSRSPNLHLTFRSISYHKGSNGVRQPHYYVVLTSQLYHALKCYHSFLRIRYRKLLDLKHVSSKKLVAIERNAHFITIQLLGEMLCDIENGKESCLCIAFQV